MNSREAFEKWAERIGCSVSRMRTRRDIYVEYDTTALWDCWQAATERAAEVCQDEMDEQFCDSDAWYSARNCRNNIREGNE